MNTPENRARVHLLGRLPEDERDAADRMLITDPAYFDALSAEEQLLVEQYVSGELSARDRRDLEEQAKLRSDLRELIVLERISRRMTVGPVRTDTGWSRMLLPLAASIALAAVGTSIYFGGELIGQKRLLADREHAWQLRDAGQKARIAQMEAQARIPEVPRPMLAVGASFFVEPYTLGSSDEPRFGVSNGSGRVELQFSIGPENRFAEYRISIQTESGSPVTEVLAKPQIVRGRYRVVAATVPADLAQGQHFEATVAGIAPGKRDERLARYAFILAPKP
jgi:hypothetical protein